MCEKTLDTNMDAFPAVAAGLLVMGWALHTHHEKQKIGRREKNVRDPLPGANVPSLADIPPEGIDVPFRLIKNNPVLPVRLKGDDHHTCWIVDSGYGFTAVDKRLAERMNLPHKRKLAVQTLQTDLLISTVVPTGYVYDEETDTYDVEIPVHQAVIRDLPFTLEETFGDRRACMRPGGILGISFLEHFVTRIDYKNRMFTFYDPKKFQYRGNGYRFDGWLEDEDYFLIPLKIDGVEANLALDTGAFATIMTRGFLEKYKKRTGHDFGERGTNGTVMASFSENVMNLHRKDVGKVELADYMFPNLEVLFPMGETPGLLNTTRFDGLLGFPVLQHFVIYLVYKPRPYVILEPNM